MSIFAKKMDKQKENLKKISEKQETFIGSVSC